MSRILYLHGFASSPASRKALYFKRLLESAGALVDAPDLSEGDFFHLSISGQLRVVQAAARGGPVSIVGSSLGGYLAALFASRYPLAQRVVLLAPAFGFARLWRQRLGDRRMDDWRREGSLSVFHYGEGRDLPLGWQLMEDAAGYEDFPALTQPALVFHGSRDDVVPPGSSLEFAARVPNARVETLESGHDLLDQLDYMGPRIVRFLLPDSRRPPA